MPLLRPFPAAVVLAVAAVLVILTRRTVAVKRGPVDGAALRRHVLPLLEETS
jgi:hypothetical protein